MILIDLIMLDHFDDHHHSFILCLRLKLACLSLHLQLADYALRLLLSIVCEGTYVDVEQLVRKTCEEEIVPLELEVLFEVLCRPDYVVVVARVQEVGSFLQVLRFVQVDDVFYPVYQLGEELNGRSEGLDMLLVVGDLQWKDETGFLVADFPLDDLVEVGVEVLCHLVSDYIS